MAVVGVLHLTSVVNPPLSGQTPATALLSRISDHFPTQVHRPFQFDHRLFVSTSSLLPQAESKRSFTHFFSSSHTPGKTYVGTSSITATTENDDGLSIVAIPASTSFEPFVALVLQKLQPQWAPRRSTVLENGASVVLPIRDEWKWRVSIGDVRISNSRMPSSSSSSSSSASSSSSGGATAGQLRGVVIEIQCESNSSNTSQDPRSGNVLDLASDEDRRRCETLFRNLLKGLFRAVPLDLKLDDAQILLTKTLGSVDHQEQLYEKEEEKVKGRRHWQDRALQSEVPELYMQVLRGTRG